MGGEDKDISRHVVLELRVIDDKIRNKKQT